jgi:hypothetical protein
MFILNSNLQNKMIELSSKHFNLDAFKQLVHKNDYVCMLAIDDNLHNFTYIDNPSARVCKYLLDKNVDTLGIIDELHQTDEIIIYALSKDCQAINKIKNPRFVHYEYIIVKYEHALKHIRKHTLYIAKLSYTCHPTSIRYINNPRIIMSVLFYLDYNPNTYSNRFMKMIMNRPDFNNDKIVIIIGNIHSCCKPNITHGLSFVTTKYRIDIKLVYMACERQDKKCLIIILSLIFIEPNYQTVYINPKRLY